MVLTSDQEAAYERLTGRALAMFTSTTPSPSSSTGASSRPGRNPASEIYQERRFRGARYEQITDSALPGPLDHPYVAGDDMPLASCGICYGRVEFEPTDYSQARVRNLAWGCSPIPPL